MDSGAKRHLAAVLPRVLSFVGPAKWQLSYGWHARLACRCTGSSRVPPEQRSGAQQRRWLPQDVAAMFVAAGPRALLPACAQVNKASSADSR